MKSLDHDVARGLSECKGNAEDRNRAYVQSATLRMQDITQLFSYQHPDFVANLYPSNAAQGKHIHIAVVLLKNGIPVKQSVEIGRPRFPWHYDLSIRVNIALITRFHPQQTPHFGEINWIALNLVDFNCNPTWEYFNRIASSLKLWGDYTRDIVIDREKENWTVHERRVVHVRIR